ncbi:MAG TPA: ATP-dependent metallopeptidase FtsH/Yme1/Tma family protein, partial [Thermoleophilaceae bacterium]|nr:ATP-dependent metallopeptidase FtsH/Yme1/Tma family protein [Thermoleophilaceae bacterium]
MSKFFKSAAFPILIVVVLAFFVQNLVSSGNEAKEPTYSDFLTQVDRDEIKKVTLNTGDNTIDVELK